MYIEKSSLFGELNGELRECISHRFSITFIEWPELIQDKLEKRIDLNFKYEENLNKRSLTISTNYKKKLLNAFK